MRTGRAQSPSGNLTAGVATVVGLLLVWGIVWANLPAKEELLSHPPPASSSSASPREPELDLSIPGVPSGSRVLPATGDVPTAPPRALADSPRARQILELKCDAEVQQTCPDSLSEQDRRQCVRQRMKQFAPACQPLLRQRMVRWKEADHYRVACAEDVQRLCREVEPGEGRILQCLQERTQDVSEGCYQSLPKGQLLLRN